MVSPGSLRPGVSTKAQQRGHINDAPCGKDVQVRLLITSLVVHHCDCKMYPLIPLRHEEPKHKSNNF